MISTLTVVWSTFLVWPTPSSCINWELVVGLEIKIVGRLETLEVENLKSVREKETKRRRRNGLKKTFLWGILVDSREARGKKKVFFSFFSGTDSDVIRISGEFLTCKTFYQDFSSLQWLSWNLFISYKSLYKIYFFELFFNFVSMEKNVFFFSIRIEKIQLIKEFKNFSTEY